MTVRALIAGSTIRIELHAPGELGRDALRAILGDLRRDLAIAAPQATLSLTTSDGSPSSPQHGGTGGQTGNGGADAQRHQATARASAVPPTPAEVPPRPLPHRPSLRSAASTSTPDQRDPMTTVDSITGTLPPGATPTSGVQTGSTTPATERKKTLDSEVFLKLLVTQLTNQDPSSP